MTDDLVKRLRDWEHVWPDDMEKPAGHLYEDAADRIEELEAELAEYKHVASAIDTQWAESQDEIADLKDKLVKAVEALASWKHYDESGEVDHVSLMLNYADAIEKTRTTLAELTGGKDG